MPLRLVCFLIALAIAGGSAIVAEDANESRRSQPSALAASFLATLTPAQRERAVAPFGDEGRDSWHYVPRRRDGVALKELNAKQRAAFEALLATLLTEEGLRKTKGVITLEGVLVELGADPRFRDDGLYFIRIFGDPSGSQPWGLRFEGHHLSLNYTSQGGASFSGTPAFFGANPHRVPRGNHEGLRVLGKEEDVARAFMKSLDDKQKVRATIADRAPHEIVTGARARARLDKFAGIPSSALTPHQRKALRKLVELYVRNHLRSVADGFLQRVDAAGFGKVHFAWAGSLRPGEPHYYRVHGPTFVIEYVNVQNGANHSHTVLRDFNNDFGRDWLAEHFERDH